MCVQKCTSAHDRVNVLRWISTVRISSEVASIFQTAQYMENFGTNQLLVQYRQPVVLPGNRGMGMEKLSARVNEICTGRGFWLVSSRA